jgi:hypothetical protein
MRLSRTALLQAICVLAGPDAIFSTTVSFVVNLFLTCHLHEKLLVGFCPSASLTGTHISC